MTAFERITHRRTIAPAFRQAPRYRAIWQTEAETPGGLDDLRRTTIATQAEMYVRQVAGRPEPGMTWRLGLIEAEMGLPDGGLTGLTDNQRRDRICARLRGWRLPTAQAIRAVALAYAGNDVQVVMDFEAFAITIRFTGTELPENLHDLEAELTRVIPAWLSPIHWVVTFLTWGDADESGVTWCQLEDAGWTWEQFEVASRDTLPTDVECTPEPEPEPEPTARRSA
jgi:hypothetical protein